MFTSNVVNNKRFRQMKHGRLWKNVILWAISRRESRLWLSSFKKIDQPSWRTTRRNYKHIPQIVCISSRFRELHLLLMGIWAIRSPLKIHCYTCMSFKTCLSRLIYTKLSSHRSLVINMYVVAKAWRCISPWNFHRSLQRRREMGIFDKSVDFRAFLVNPPPPKKKRIKKPHLNARKHWESESRIAACQRQYYM